MNENILHLQIPSDKILLTRIKQRKNDLNVQKYRSSDC